MGRGLPARVAELEWYHTLELAPGIVTPGWFDLRGTPDRMAFPSRLDGMRCLDVGTFDGFWAFTMEQRGASEVVAIDILDPSKWDWPLASAAETVGVIGKRKAGGAGFDVAREALSSRVERRELSVYDLDPSVVGTFDVVYTGSLLLHLRDPVAALERIRSVCRGTLIACDAIDPLLSWLFAHRPVAGLDAVGRPWWWKPNVAGLRRMVEAAGFELVAPPERIRMPAGAGQPRPRVSALARPRAWPAVVSAARGDPHAVIRARPREVSVHG